MKDVERLVASLSPIERLLVPHLEDGLHVNKLAKKAGVQEVQAMRGCQFLSNKDVVAIISEESSYFERTSLGEMVSQDGFPEQRFFEALSQPISISDLQEQLAMDKQEFNISMGILRGVGAIEIDKGNIHKKDAPDFDTPLSQLSDLATLNADNQKQFLKRGLISEQRKTTHAITLQPNYKKLQKADLSKQYEELLTHDMLKTGTWKDKDFRHYDVTTPVPAVSYGRAHFVQEAIANIKQIWVEMGFEEMTGEHAQTAFWDLDALFVPQDHPAREEQDTFYLPEKGTLPKWYADIARVHEDGADTGSTGWQTTYDADEASKVLLRTHTTVLSAQYLKNLDLSTLPKKYFSVAKVFRNETLDWKHLAEFHQVEGIVVGEGLNIQDLIGLQKAFYKRMGFDKIRFRPAYFPYTEPSAEVEVYHPKKKQWVELGGMGVFRPEVVKPLLGKDIPVLAWGLGMERIITDYYEISDLRDIYSNELSRLRTAPAYMEEENANN